MSQGRKSILTEEDKEWSAKLALVNEQLAKCKIHAPEFDKLLAEKQLINVKLFNIHYKLGNLKANKPELGTGDEMTVNVPTQQPTKQF